MEEHDMLSLNQPSATCWPSLERTVKGIHANRVSLVLELKEEENARNCPVARSIRKCIQTYTFPALSHLLSDEPHESYFQKDDVNILHNQPVLNMTLASLEDLMNGPGETEFNKALQVCKFCGITVTHIAELTKSIRKKISFGACGSQSTVLNAFRYPGADSALKSYGLDALEHVCDHYGTQRGAVAPLVQKEHMLHDFLSVKRVRAGSGNLTFRESCKLLITSPKF